MFAREHYHVVHVQRDFVNEVPNAFLSHWDVARLLYFSLQSLDVPVTLSVNQLSFTATNIIVGYERLPAGAIPAGTRYIPYQLEQLGEGGHTIHPNMLEVLRGAWRVWEYSPANMAILRQEGVAQAHLLPLGYHEKLATIPSGVEDVDVVFYGSQNPRREKILDALRERCALVNLFGIYGEQRDSWIARSKVSLNMHFYDAGVAEQARVSYLLNNRRCVVSEESSADPFAEFCRVVPYEGLVEGCLALVRDAAARERLLSASWEGFTQMRMTEHLRRVL